MSAAQPVPPGNSAGVRYGKELACPARAVYQSPRQCAAANAGGRAGNNVTMITVNTQKQNRSNMNRKAFSLLTGMLLGSFVMGSAVVQAQTTNAPTPGVQPASPGARPAMRDRTEVLAQRLNLTDDQKTKIKPILDEQTKKLMDLRLEKDLKPDERRAKVLAIRDESDAKVKAILTPEQWEKYPRMPAPRTNTVVRPAAPAPAAPAK